MYPYHNRIKQRIKNGELTGIEKGSGEYALIFIFSTPPYRRPIRHSSMWRYEKLNLEGFLDKKNHDES